MKLHGLEKDLEMLSKKSEIKLDPKSEADQNGNMKKNPFSLDLELMAGSRPRSVMPL